MKNISLKFIDIMIGVILGLGFQWFTVFTQPWQYVAFIFVYLDIIDYWIDYSPSLKKFPPKKEFDLLIDVAILFSLFLYIYSIQLDLWQFLAAFCLFKAMDFFWLLRAERQYKPKGEEKIFIHSWLMTNVMEIGFALALILLALQTAIPPIFILLIYIVFRIIFRFMTSSNYKKVYFF